MFYIFWFRKIIIQTIVNNEGAICGLKFAISGVWNVSSVDEYVKNRSAYMGLVDCVNVSILIIKPLLLVLEESINVFMARCSIIDSTGKY